MAVQEILIWPDSRLLQKSEPVESLTPEVIQIIEDMKDTLEASKGMGLSAIQIGIPKQLIVAQLGTAVFVFMNPSISSATDLLPPASEGCLSLPNEFFQTRRFNKIRISYVNFPNMELRMALTDISAIVFQHEYDHLQGKLLVMNPSVGPMKRDIIRRRLIKYKKSLKKD